MGQDVELAGERGLRYAPGGGRVAVNFSKVTRDRWWGRVLRLPLKLLPRELVLPVLQGPGRGLKWIVGSASHGFWLGSFEPRETQTFIATIHEGDVVYDIGAHVGWYTLVASRTVGSTGWVIGFEPLEENLAFCLRHMELNGVTNVKLLQTAAGRDDGEKDFKEGVRRSSGRLTAPGSGDFRVEVARIDSLISSGRIPPPDVVKIDVEGAEVDVLLGSYDTLRRHSPSILLSTHGVDAQLACGQILTGLGYELRPVSGPSLQSADVWMATSNGT